MRQIAKFLAASISRDNSNPRMPAASEMTLHDALRICGGHYRTSPSPRRARPPVRQVDISRYDSHADLHVQWKHCDLRPALASMTVVLALDETLQGNLRELVRRDASTDRLILVPQAGHWPGTDSACDLALAAASLGWTSIGVCRDLALAIQESLALRPAGRLLVLLPARVEAAAAM